MKTEIELLREIAAEAKNVWDKGQISFEAIHLKNLLTDRIDIDERKAASQQINAADEGGRAVLEGVDYIVNNVDGDTISLTRR